MPKHPRNLQEMTDQGHTVTNKNRPLAAWTASRLEKRLGAEEIEQASAKLHRLLDPLMRINPGNPYEAVCQLSEIASGRGDSCLVALGDEGPTAVPLPAAGQYGPETHYWLGFAEIEETKVKPYCRITKLYPLTAWGEHQPLIEEIMATAYVWGS